MIRLQERVHGGNLPETWSNSRLRTIFNVRKGNKNVALKQQNLLSLSYGRIVPKDIETAVGLVPESFETYQIVEAGNIIMRLTDLQNDKRSLRQGLVSSRGMITSAYDALQIAPPHEPRFWFYALLALDLAKYYYSLGGGVRQSISFRDFPNEWIGVPPPEVQQEIASFLDRETFLIDRLIQAKEKLSEILASKRNAAITGAISEGVSRMDWNKSKQAFEFIFRKQGWLELRTKHAVKFMTSGSRGWSEFLSPEGDVFVQSGNIGKEMNLDLSEANRIARQEGAEAERTVVNAGDVLLCITGGRTGAVAYVREINERAHVNQHICLLRARAETMMPKLLAHVLWSEFGQAQIGAMQYGMKQGLGFSEVGDIRVPVPPRAQQPEIVRHIEHSLSVIDDARSRLTSSIDKLLEFRSSLITAAVTGQIDVKTWRRRDQTELSLNRLEAKAMA
jgi:type I restriction enzyme, S subunit